MLPFRHRISVVLWVLWLVWCIPVFFALAEPYVKAKPEAFSSSHPPSAFVVPVSVVEAYKLGRMTDQERLEFETDLRSGQIGLPSGMSLVVPARYPDFTGALGNFCLLVFLPGLGIALIQFLLVGFASPFQLLSSHKTHDRKAL